MFDLRACLAGGGAELGRRKSKIENRRNRKLKKIGRISAIKKSIAIAEDIEAIKSFQPLKLGIVRGQ
jgi:hypothetical protein